MARRLAVLIGVGRPKGLTPLPGTKSGIDEFGDWARRQGFAVVELTDFDGQPVRAENIFQVIDQATAARDLDQLFVYFAGHGTGLGMGVDLWLLDEATTNPNQAINATHSWHLAKRSGVPHVAFFADACRSPAGKEQLGLLGQSIFPANRSSELSRVDIFLATRSGDAAVERVPEGVAEKAFGIFTRCLLTGLRGEAPRAVREVSGGPLPRAVLARDLSEHLEDSVRLTAALEADIDQSPDCTPVSDWQPHALAWHPAVAPATDGRPDRPISLPPEDDGDAVRPGFRLAPRSGPPSPSSRSGRTLSRLYRQEQDRIRRTAVRYSAPVADEQASVVGAAVRQIFTGERTSVDVAAPMLLELRTPQSENRWAASAALPGFTFTATVVDDGVDHLAYLPSGGRPQLSGERLRDTLAEAGARAALGRFDPDADDPALRTALFRDLNPTLVVLAGYEYAKRGQDEAVQDLVLDLVLAGRPVPFDLVLLCGTRPDRIVERTRQHRGRGRRTGTGVLDVHVVPGFPLRASGWALVETIDWTPVEPLIQARPGLAHAPWTTFRELPFDLRSALLGRPEPWRV